MRKELNDRLSEEFPRLFTKYGRPSKETCFSSGASCGDGWYPLIRGLCVLLENEFKSLPEDTQKEAIANEKLAFEQIKQKFCLLRIYIDYLEPSVYPWSNASLRMMKFIELVEAESAFVCEECGGRRSGKFAGPSIGRASCEDCNKEITNG